MPLYGKIILALLGVLIIAALEESGIFLLKGAVKDVAAGLGCSQASVYRYLSQVKK